MKNEAAMDGSEEEEVDKVLLDKFSDETPMDPSATNLSTKNLIRFHGRVSIITQFYFCLWKDMLLLLRSPISLFLVLASGPIFMVISWAVGGRVDVESDEEYIFPPPENFTECGSVNASLYPHREWYWSSDDGRIAATLNEEWRDGVEVAMMGLAGLVQAIFAFQMVNNEIQAELLGVLRALGLRDSVYWLSWYTVFANVALMNSLLASATAKLLPGHVYESIFFWGIFGSLLALNLALISASLFLVAACGTGNKIATTFILLAIIVAAFIPLMVQNVQSWAPHDLDTSPNHGESAGLFWEHKSTMTPIFDWNFDHQGHDFWNETGNFESLSPGMPNITFSGECNSVIMNEVEGTRLKSELERAEISNNDFFVGCYVRPSWNFDIWKKNSPVGRLLLFFFPYFHFNNIWSSFVGYTAMPNRQFSSAQATTSQDILAMQALPNPPGERHALVTTMAPQGSTFLTQYAPQKTFLSGNFTYYQDPWSNETYAQQQWVTKTACPLPDHPGAQVCDNQYASCGYAVGNSAVRGGPSVADNIGMLLALSLMYLLLAAYFSVVFPGKNGKGETFYFFLSPGYWRDDSPENGHVGEDGVVVDGVRKTYGKFDALKDVSFKMNTGEVTALLGHNGAGKTTLSSILCCEIKGTEGDIRVFGQSVLSNPFVVRGMVGLCKQDDYLWGSLSAKEHLQLFAGLRGVSSRKSSATVQKWLESVDLDSVQDHYSSSFSGGMKRRLSVALATIGGRPVIVLDEPTTGMDPVSRRFVWKHIDSIKRGRVILLTTHAMEEADLLADEVAIMRNGQLAAFGSPLQLKTDYGTALQFSLLVHKERIDEAKKYIADFFAGMHSWVHVEYSDAGTVTARIDALRDEHSQDGIEISTLISFVTWLDDPASPVTEYGFSNSSLEEVFLRVTGGEGARVGESRESPNVADVDEIQMETVDGGVDVETPVGSVPDLSSWKPHLRMVNQTKVILFAFFRRGWTGMGSAVNYFIFGGFLLGSILLGLIFGSEQGPLGVMSGVVFFMSILLVAIIGPAYVDRFEGQFFLMRSQGLLPSGYITGFMLHAFILQFIYSFLTVTGVYLTPFFAKSVLCEENLLENSDGSSIWYESSDCYNYAFGSKEIVRPMQISNFQDTYNDSPVTLRAFRAPGGYGMVFGLAFASAIATVGQGLTTAFLPGYRVSIVFVMAVTLVASIAPLLVTLPYKSTEDLIDCYNITFPKYCEETMFSRDNVNAEFLDCVGFAVNNYAARTFCLPASAGLLSHFGLYQMFAAIYTARITFISEPEGYVVDVLLPSLEKAKCNADSCKFPFASRMFGMSFFFTILGGVLLIFIGIGMSYILAFSFGPFLRFRQSVLLFFGCYSRERTSFKCDVTEGHSEDELPEVTEESVTVRGIMAPLLKMSETGLQSIDFRNMSREELDPVIMHKLRKVYPAIGGRPPKVALESLDLRIPKGQVIGLLGKNGAGKTTALKILAGAHESSSGHGLVAGYDCNVEKIEIFERLGNCAQFDVVWKGQTVQQHLEFFAALKGLPKREIKTAAREIANAVGLGSDAVYTRAAGSLSGGMRRRLSIGLALIGSPSVVVLDEPTTGLDPSTRSSIWSLINSFASHDRSMIITTHMMIEADTLCNRIAIVARGKLVVVGTQQHLKDKFGSGYILQLNLVQSTPEHQERALKFVRENLHPDATVGIRQAKTLHIHLPRDIRLEKVFRALYSKERTTEGGINQFLLSQSSLEEVFITLGD